MALTRIGLIVGGWLLGALSSQIAWAQDSEQKVYVVNLVDTAPIVDGIETAPDEWGAAMAEGSGDWAALTSNSPDMSNNRFAAVWDASGIFFRHEVDFGAWQNRGRDAFDATYEILNLFFDPNADGEPNGNTEVFGTSVDGYKLSFNQPLGESSIDPDLSTAGFSSEAYVNSAFGNSAGEFSSFGGMIMSQTTSVDNQFGYTELFIPWTDFDAAQDHPSDVGLYHPQPPADGEEWFFNMSRTQTNFVLPAWASPPGAFFFSERPHGILKFSGSVGMGGDCDIDGDGDCDTEDIDAIARAILEGSTEEQFDVNGDGIVSEDDRVFFVVNTLNTYLGDSNLDGMFGTQDFVAIFVAGGYEDGIPGNATFATGDWNGDLDFTTQDFVITFVNGGFEEGPRPPVGDVAPVPEPASFGLLCMGLLCVGRLLRRN